MARIRNIDQSITPSSIESKRQHFLLSTSPLLRLSVAKHYAEKFPMLADKRPHITRSMISFVAVSDCLAYVDIKAREHVVSRILKNSDKVKLYGWYNVGDTKKRLKSKYILPLCSLGSFCGHPGEKGFSRLKSFFSISAKRFLKLHVSADPEVF